LITDTCCLNEWNGYRVQKMTARNKEDSGPGHTVLLVDDNPEVLQTLDAILSRAGHRIIARPDALSAIATIREGAPVDVIVTDYKLPNMDGMEFLARLKESAPAIPVIILTGYGSVETSLKFINLGAYDYILKPVLPGDLRRIVRAAVSSSAKYRSNNALVM
jgi:DNA-binding NtrC family response regulator